MIRGYKVTDKDMKCRGFQYQLNKWFHTKGDIYICGNGFHWCKQTNDCFDYYSFDPKNRVFEIEVKGKTIEDGNKSCSRSIRLIRELSWQEVLELINTGEGNTGRSNSGDRNSGYRNSGNRNSGDGNSGDCNSGDRNSGDGNSGDGNSGDGNSGYCNSGDRNSGDRNSGDWNSGNCNSGDCNSGDRNSGNWNSCNSETGYFNSTSSNEIRVFNKPCKLKDWEGSKKPEFIFNIKITKWVNDFEMSDDEKDNNPNWQSREGYLKTLSYKEAWAEAFKGASKEDVDLLKKLPNFCPKVFKEITGLEVYWDWAEVKND